MNSAAIPTRHVSSSPPPPLPTTQANTDPRSKQESSMNRNRIAATTLTLAGAMTLILTGCSTAGSGGGKIPRLAMGAPGEAQIAVWNSVADQFKKANPEWSVELNFQNDDLYETIGLPNLLNGRKAPDI